MSNKNHFSYRYLKINLNSSDRFCHQKRLDLRCSVKGDLKMR